MKENKLSRFDIYKCDKYGIIAQIMTTGAGKLVCCETSMDKMIENTTDAAKEKHIPVVEKIGNRLEVKVGSVNHPMNEDHFIQWVEVVGNEESFLKFLSYTDKPEAVFDLECDEFYVRAYCNLHGLWRS